MNFDPIHWACVVLGVILGLTLSIGGTMYWKQGMDLKVCKADAAAFEARTEAAGTKSELERVGTEDELRHAAVNIQGRLNNAYADNARLHVEYTQRLLNAEKRSSVGQTDKLGSSAGGYSCTNGNGRLVNSLATLESELREGFRQHNIKVQPILESRDRAIIRTQECKAYIEQLHSILRNPEVTDVILTK